MPKTNKKGTIDKQQDRSDVQSLLMVIKRLFETSQEVINTHTQTTLMLSVTIEAQMLLMKLQVMKERWKYHPPFKEACHVRFDYWSKVIERMASSLSLSEESSATVNPVNEYCPSKHFLLDLYENLPEVCKAPGYTPSYLQTNVPRFVANQNRIRKLIANNWLTSYEQRFSDLVAGKVGDRLGTSLNPLSDNESNIFQVCHDTLAELSAVLSELNAQSKSEIQSEQFARLAERVSREIDYGGKKAEESARNDVHIWKNKTPRKQLEKTLRDEIETSVNIIREMKYGKLIIDYIGEECDIKDHKTEIGQYLYNVRCDISTDELNDLMEQLYRIRFFKEKREKQDATQHPAAPIPPPAVPAQPPLPVEKSLTSEFLRPELPIFFTEKVVGNAKKTEKFYDDLHRIACHIKKLPITKAEKRNSPYMIYWQWNHVRKACENLKFIVDDTPKQHFAEFLHSVFPFLKVSSILKSFQRHPETANGFDKIVKDIEYEFYDVTKD